MAFQVAGSYVRTCLRRSGNSWQSGDCLLLSLHQPHFRVAGKELGILYC
jgi:hypothetical protein